MVEELDVLNETKQSVDRLVNFDLKSLPRTEELGRSFSFQAAVDPAKRVIELFKRLPLAALDEFPTTQLNAIKQHADQFYLILNTALKFSATDVSNPTSERDQIVQQLEEQYPTTFKLLHPYIAYSVARTVDFNKLDEQGRAAVQGIEDRTEKLIAEIVASQSQIQKTLEDVRTAAAEQGVSQQAIYFKEAADSHRDQAATWLFRTLVSAAVLTAYSISTIFSHNIPGLSPSSTYEAIQIAVGKALVFAVGSYVVIVFGRNFLSQKHNEIINRHRQNALQTFTTLVDASASSQAQDIVLSHAAASIFEPQETGYAKQQTVDGSLSASTVLRSLAGPGQP